MKAENFLLENSLQAKSTFTLAIAAYALSLGDRTHSQFRSIASALKRAALVKGMTFLLSLFSQYLLYIQNLRILGDWSSEIQTPTFKE